MEWLIKLSRTAALRCRTRQRVRITEMFGSNSPRRPERASDQRVRLAHPDSQIQLSNSVTNFRVALATAFNYTATRTIRQAPTTPFASSLCLDSRITPHPNILGPATRSSTPPGVGQPPAKPPFSWRVRRVIEPSLSRNPAPITNRDALEPCRARHNVRQWAV